MQMSLVSQRPWLSLAWTLLLVTPTLSESSEFVCPKPDGDFRNPGELCSSVYYTCRDGEAVKKACRDGTVFNSIIGGCDTSEKVRFNTFFWDASNRRSLALTLKHCLSSVRDATIG